MTRLHARQRRPAVALALLCVAALALFAGPGTRSAGAQEEAAVSIVDFAFEPAALEVAAGTTVTWTNQGAAPHTVTADDGAFDSGNLGNDQSYSHKFTKAGEYAYHCEHHPRMKGKIVVQK